ncbi:XRE family transcriptional regulator [Streptomyces sp. NPDC021100]|uniref:XRE family transcriptional regulator n=1 Tax=Streptomyces sp. NPDC021100 TaxID=3365114 RepID=UPI0037949671
MGDEAPAEQGTIARKLAFLISTVHPSGRGPYSYAELERLIKQQAGADGPTVSGSAIQAIATGRVSNPGIQALKALAKFFGVPVGYFVDDETHEDKERARKLEERLRELRAELDRAQAAAELAQVLEDAQARAIAARLGGLSAKTLQGIKLMVESARQVEGLPAAEEDIEGTKRWQRRRRA